MKKVVIVQACTQYLQSETIPIGIPQEGTPNFLQALKEVLA